MQIAGPIYDHTDAARSPMLSEVREPPERLCSSCGYPQSEHGYFLTVGQAVSFICPVLGLGDSDL
jgi:hypothetical protein